MAKKPIVVHKTRRYRRRMKKRDYLPPHTFEAHPLTKAGEVSKPMVIAIASIIGIVLLAVLLLFSGKFVGKAIYTVSGKGFAPDHAGIRLVDNRLEANTETTIPIKADIGDKETVAIGFALASPQVCNGNEFVSGERGNHIMPLLDWDSVVYEDIRCEDSKLIFKMATLDYDEAKTGEFDIAEVGFTTGDDGSEVPLEFHSFEVYELGTMNNIVAGHLYHAEVQVGPCVPSGEEVCDGMDNDCDGTVDVAENVATDVVETVCKDALHCGLYLNDCGIGECTEDLQCTCLDGFATCGGNVCDTDLKVDAQNCGECANVCPVGEECRGGVCAVPIADCTDADEDGYCVESVAAAEMPAGKLGGDDCDDADATTNPGATELCDRKDHDCDSARGLHANGFITQNGAALTRPAQLNLGVCSDLVEECKLVGIRTYGWRSGGRVAADIVGYAAVETGDLCADTLDNDCDGKADAVDTGCGGCEAGASQLCNFQHGESICVNGGIQNCTAGAWGECVATFEPVGEICDGIDNDCSGEIDDMENCCNASILDWQTDAANCGGCGLACAAGENCEAGSCIAQEVIEGTGISIREVPPQENQYATRLVSAEVPEEVVEVSVVTILRDANGKVLVMKKEIVSKAALEGGYTASVNYAGDVKKKDVFIEDKDPAQGGQLHGMINKEYD